MTVLFRVVSCEGVSRVPSEDLEEQWAAVAYGRIGEVCAGIERFLMVSPRSGNLVAFVEPMTTSLDAEPSACREVAKNGFFAVKSVFSIVLSAK